MKKLNPYCIEKLFTDCFELIRPVEDHVDKLMIHELVNQLVLLKISTGPDSSLLIKGQFTYIEGDQKLFFTGTPWFNSIEGLRKTNLMMNDFPHHNPTVDLLHLLKTEEIINQDLSRLVETINEQKNKLKKGEEQILISLQKERELNQLKSNFISLASHEFRTPLACIRSSIELLQINLTRPDSLLHHTIRHHNNILTEVDRLSELIDEVLTVGKIESDTLTCKKEVLDLSQFSKNIINNLVHYQNDERSVSLIMNRESSIIMADPLLLKHILNNLLSNSLKYSKGRKQPVLELIVQKKQVHIKIKDFGIGIPYDQQASIFQVFFRADNALQIEGTGLGMFITKNFIELHEGQISFKSSPGKGTEFIVSLPVN